ncbi:MAG: SLBB domain-containing protein [Nitrososphaeraceae archaeon]|nr:SLBB domain-containing protein [Nitrososphaeraceae archaeon]
MERRMVLLMLLFFVFSLLLNISVFSQEKYILGEEQQLQIMVYVLGEVDKPGEYLVPDKTNLVELLSKAGGQTEFTNLGSVRITRLKTPLAIKSMENDTIEHVEKEIIRFNVSEYLKTKNGPPPPVLKPGDVIYVNKNKWYTWRTVAAVLRDLAIVASTYILYVRYVK